MALNGISTHLPKSERRDLKLITIAEPKRQTVGTIGYRGYNIYISPGTFAPILPHPWLLDPNWVSGEGIDAIVNH